jgi:hypothetical protein
MPTPPLSDENAIEAYQAFQAHGNITAAAAALGMDRGTYRNRLRVAELRGLTGRTPPAPTGFEVKAISETTDDDGNVKSRSVKFQHESGGDFQAPEGHRIKGMSVLTDADGQIRAKWTKTAEIKDDPARVAEIIKTAFADFKPFAPAIIRAKDHDQDRLTAYICCDWHIGMFAYGKETGGPDWDLSIARKSLVTTFAEVVEQSPLSHSAVVLGLGDLMHADNPRNQTPTSGNVMDVDTRYSKCLPTTCDVMAEAVELVRQKHKHVDVSILEGNHDISSTVGIRSALRMFYRNDSRVDVSDSPNPFYWRRFGVNLIGAAHGHNTKPADLPLIMANVRAQDWSETVSRHIHTGHIHHDSLKEMGGVRVYSHRAPIPQDAYHAAKGYLSGRSMRSFTYHRERGARGSNEVEIL